MSSRLQVRARDFLFYFLHFVVNTFCFTLLFFFSSQIIIFLIIVLVFFFTNVSCSYLFFVVLFRDLPYLSIYCHFYLLFYSLPKKSDGTKCLNISFWGYIFSIHLLILFFPWEFPVFKDFLNLCLNFLLPTLDLNCLAIFHASFIITSNCICFSCFFLLF